MFAASKTDSASTGGYQISRSLRFNSADSAYLNRTPASAGNRQTWTLSVWVKRGSLGAFNPIFSAGPVSPRASILFQSDDKLQVRQVDSTDTEVIKLVTTQVFRDPSAWYHIVVAQDTTQATSSNRVKIYVNGTQITAFDTATYPSQNISNLAINAALEHNYGRYVNSPSDGYLSAYLTETNFIDGQQLTPSSFGETNAQTGVWQPKAYSGSYGTNGFYLNFSDNSNTTAATLGKDYSGNGNNWTPNNFSVTAGAGNDSLVDSPTSYGTDTGVGGTVRGNYATLNPLVVLGTSAFTNGNLDVSVSSANTNNFATIAIPTSGKWYWEYQITSVGGGAFPMAGIIATGSSALTSNVVYRTNGDKNIDGTGSAYGATYTTTDIIGVAVDTDGGTVTFYKNGSSQGAITYATSSGNYSPALRSNAATDNFTFNFGQRPFAYTAPSGFKALCTQNLPTPTIGATTATQAGKYFNPVLYTGTGSDNRAVTGVGFQPDFVWVKGRDIGQSHVLNNAVAGVGTAKTLYSNLSVSQGTYDDYGYLQSLDADGYTIKNGSINGNLVNASGYQYVAWNWKANGSGSTNTAGSITSTVSANTTSGFSVVTWTSGSGAGTVGHGLGATPKMIITKIRSTVDDWYVYHQDIGNTKTLFLDTTNGQLTTTVWNNTSPTSSVFTYFGSNTQTYVAYCFAEVAGYSKFGSYTGNGNTNRNFVYLGFTPAVIMVKRTSSAGTNWRIVNPRRVYLSPNTSDAEYASYPGPFLQTANGFEISGGDDVNENGGTFIYAAFASVPFKFSLAQ